MKAIRLKPRFTVGGTEVHLSSFALDCPENRMGALLNLSLQRPNLSQIPLQQPVAFELGARTAQSGWSWAMLLSGGRLSGRDLQLAWAREREQGRPADTVRCGVMDALGDRFNRRPRNPVTMYDPERVDYSQVKPDTLTAIHNFSGAAILPVLEPINGLSAHDVLNRAYTSNYPLLDARFNSSALSSASRGAGTGLGFSRVITNIPNYRVTRADFTFESGWHDAAAGFVSMFDPVYYTDGLNALYIIDPAARLPFGFVAHELPLDCVISLGLVEPSVEFTAAVIFSYLEQTGNDLVYADRVVTDDAVESGKFGAPGYQRSQTTHRIREWTLASDAAQVVTRQELETTTEVIGAALDSSYGTLERTVQRNSYSGFLKTGHHKTVDTLLPDLDSPGAPLLLQRALEENCEIQWTVNPENTKQWIQQRSITRVEGLALVSNDTRRIGGQDIEKTFPAISAHRSGITEEDAGSHEWRSLKTITETLQVTGNGQLDVHVEVIDQLTGVSQQSSTQPRTGDNLTATREERSRSVIIYDSDTEEVFGERRPSPMNAGQLPYWLALRLAQRKLLQLISPAPRRTAQITLPGVDFSIRRGSLLSPHHRSGVAGLFLVTGYRITGDNLGVAGQQSIQQTLTCVEVQQ